jgi:hypothetical protein
MAQQDINVGSAPNDGTGDPLRTAYIKCNNNFSELYSIAQTNPPASLNGTVGDFAGMYAYDSNYFYYCYQDFDDSSQIWNQVAQIGNVSVTQIASGNSSVQFSDIAGNVLIDVNGTASVMVVTSNSATVTGNLTATNRITGGNLYSLGLVSSIGTVTAPFFVGNGAFLTGITAATTYGNANVAVFLPTYSGSLPSLSGNVTTDGNLTGAMIYGNGSQLTGMYGNANVATYLNGSVGNIIPVANVTYGLGNSTHQWKDLWVSNSTIYINSVPVSINSSNTLTVSGQAVLTNGGNAAVSTTGNISAANIAATGTITGSSASAGGNITGGNLITAGTVSAAGNITGNYILGNGSQITGLPANYGNTQVASYLPTYTGSFASLTGNVTTTANVSAGNVLFSGAFGTTVSTSGNITGSNLFGASTSVSGNVIGGNVLTVGIASATGNITGGNVSTDGLISATGNITGGNIRTAGIVVTTGNLIGGNVSTSGVISATGNITGGNIRTVGTVSATGNIAGNFFIGNGSALTGITGTVTGNVSSANVTYVAPYTSSVSRTANSKFSDTVSVKDFGAVGNGVADDRAAIQAAIDTQKRVYLPEGTYRVGSAVGCYYQGQILYGDGRNKTIILADNINYSFNLADTAVLVFTPGEPGPSLRDIGIKFVQPVTSNRASLINYPPAIYAQNVPRFQILNCRITQGMTGIDMRLNSGGAIINGLEMSCYNYGVRIDGSLDTVRIINLQYWPFDISGTANESIFFDSTNRGVVSGRCDDLKINGCLFINGGIQVELQTTASGTTFGAITDTDFDNTASYNQTGGFMSMMACYFTIGNGLYNPITLSGNGILRVSSSEFSAAVAVTNAFIQESGSVSYLQVENCTFRNSSVGAGFINQNEGTAIVNGCQFVVPSNLAFLNPLVAVAGGRMSFVNNRCTDKGTSASNLISIVNNNWHVVTNNAAVGWSYSYPGTTTQMVIANNS